jgi:hypothetical protein
MFLVFSYCVALGFAVQAQTATGNVHGTVADPSGAVIPASTVTLTSSTGGMRTAASDATGGYAFDRVEPGRYTISASAEGFAQFTPVEVLVFGGKSVTKNLALQLPIAVQQVKVDEDSHSLDTSADSNVSAIVIKGKALDALSDDPDELQNELTALAGPSAGPSGGQIYIDGFTGGQLPPKSSIREIRVNQNPFSAQYDKLGYGRIEILTKPGTDTFHGTFMMNGNDSAFNSLTPFVKSEPSYYSTFMMANAGGALDKSASWFGSVFRRDNHSNAIINAIDPKSGASYSAAVANPQSRLDVSPRFDFQLGKGNTLTVRYMFDRDIETNDGVSGTSLQSQAYNVTDHENTIQLSDTQVLSNNVVNETRFQYMRDRNSTISASSDPTVTVQGSFTTGGNSTGVSRENEDHYELQNVTMVSKGAHSISAGGRLRVTRDSIYSNAGFNGTFTYDCYQAVAGTSTESCQYPYVDSVVNGTKIAKQPSKYTVTAGTGSALVDYFDLGFFYQDDYKLRQNLTLSYGLRYETQNSIGDHNDWTPRLSFAWAPAAKNGKPASTVIRGGYGWFYDRFAAGNVLNSIRYNGVRQKSYTLSGSAINFNELPTSPNPIPTADQLATSSNAAPALYEISPNLKAALSMQAAIGVEHQFGKIATASATYINSRGVHQYLADNINAYEASTYDYSTGTGTRPNGVNENVYQYQSGGIFKQNQLMVNYSVNAKRVTLFGFYMLNFANADTSGASYFPSNQTNPSADYGRASFDTRQRFLLGGSIQAPYGISLSPMMDVNSGSPYNITLGEDLNGDNQLNDRPAYATSSSTSTKVTSYGTFDLDPAWNAARIPINMGTGPSQFSLNMRVSKSVGIGPKVTGPQGYSGGGPGGPPPGGGPGGGLGPGGLSRSGGPPKMDQATARRYSLNFAVMAHNVLNNVNMAAPNGVLSSSLFGKSTSLAGGFFSSAASNRSIDMQVSFNF